MIIIYRMKTSQLPDEEAVEKNLIFLDEVRQQKVNQCRNIEDKKRSLLAGYLIQAGIKEWMLKEGGLQENAIPLSLPYIFSEHGKPYIRGKNNLYFNLSHSGGYVVCAFSDKEVGIDIQIRRERKGDIAQRFFSREDKALMEKLTREGADPDEVFFGMWTVKEAYMKLTGEGMSQGLDASVIEELHGGREEADSEDGNEGKRNAAFWWNGRIRKRTESNKSAYFRSYEECDGKNKYHMTVCSYEKIDDIKGKEIDIRQ